MSKRHTELLALLCEHGLDLASTAMIGDSTFLVSDERTTTASRVPPLQRSNWRWPCSGARRVEARNQYVRCRGPNRRSIGGASSCSAPA